MTQLWLLVLVFYGAGVGVRVPGYESQQACKAAAEQTQTPAVRDFAYHTPEAFCLPYTVRKPQP